jgi:hypothetical protein
MQKLIAVFTKTSHRTLSQVSKIHSIRQHPMSLRSVFNIHLPSSYRPSKWSFPTHFPAKMSYNFSFPSCIIHVSPFSFFLFHYPNNICCRAEWGSQDNSVGITTGYGLCDWGSIPDRGKIICFYSTASTPALDPTLLPLQRVPRAPSPRAKRPGSKADHSPPSTAEIKKSGALPPLPHMSSLRGA